VKLHPVHMMFVHFPAALLPMDLIFSLAAMYFGQDKLGEAAYYCLMAGVIGGWITVVTGLFDLFRYLIIPENTSAGKGIVHGIIQTLMIAGSTGVLALEYHNPSYIYHMPAALWIGKIILLITLLFGNYLGGDLVLRVVSKQFRTSE
jgi:uncharacterized membrane protein